MGTYGNLWELVGTYGNFVRGNLWELMGTLCVGTYGNLWDLRACVRHAASQFNTEDCILGIVMESEAADRDNLTQSPGQNESVARSHRNEEPRNENQIYTDTEYAIGGGGGV